MAPPGRIASEDRIQTQPEGMLQSPFDTTCLETPFILVENPKDRDWAQTPTPRHSGQSSLMLRPLNLSSLPSGESDRMGDAGLGRCGSGRGVGTGPSSFPCVLWEEGTALSCPHRTLKLCIQQMLHKCSLSP